MKIIRKIIPLFLLVGVAFWLLTTVEPQAKLPSIADPLRFYSPQTDDHLKTTVLRSLNQAKKSIWVRIYSCTDPEVIALLNEKVREGVIVQVDYDAKASKQLKKKLSPLIRANSFPMKSGIQHQKLWVIDEQEVWFGSTNLTSKSLMMHDNLLIGWKNPELAKWLIRTFNTHDGSAATEFNEQFYLLPSQGPHLQKLLEAIDKCEETLHIAMFTWTHRKLKDAVIRAYKRGVDVKIITDESAIEGVSYHVLHDLQEAKIPIHTQQGLALMHHKFALIDDKLLVTGSANWSHAAFKRNAETLAFFELPHQKRKYFRKLWTNLWYETFSLQNNR